MYDLSHHPYFTEYVDEKSGVRSYILTERVAEVQQHFYFAQPSVSPDGKYLWFRCAMPPARYRTLGVVCLDPENPFIRHFPNAQCSTNPALDPTDPESVYFPLENCLYKINVKGEITKVLEVGNDILKNRKIDNLLSHVSVSSDNKYVVLDMVITGRYYLAIGDLETKEIRILNKFGRCYDHAMFSPTHPDRILLDQDWWRDRDTGEYFPINNRMWIATRDAKQFYPLIPEMFYGRDGSEMAHDYWSGDGYVCWSDYYGGAYECNVDTKEANRVWARPIIHSHCSEHREMFVGDFSPYAWNEKPCRVIFYDRKTNKEIDVFSALPIPKYPRAWYHPDPHPQFCAEDSLIVCTTTVRDGNMDVALTPVAPLLEKCRAEGETVIPTKDASEKLSGWLTRVESPSYD